MENKVVYRNDADISTFTWNHKSTLPKLQKVVNELKSLGISNFEGVFEDLLYKGTRTQAQLQETVSKEIKKLQARAVIQTINDQLKEDLLTVDDLCTQGKDIFALVSDKEVLKLDVNLFEIINGVVKLVDDFQNQVENRYSVFIDTPEKEEIYLKVMKVKEDIESLQAMISKNDATLGVIASIKNKYDCFLNVHWDKSITLNSEYFGWL